jgi:hypothetical protein
MPRKIRIEGRKHRPRSAGASRQFSSFTDMLAASIGQGNSVTTVATPLQ